MDYGLRFDVRIVFFGPPGTGKGSLALLCQTQLGLAHLSAGEIFRQEIARGTALGRRVARYVKGGRLVPDDLVVAVMVSRLPKRLLTKGFVLDGFPRTAKQAEGLDRALARKRAPLDAAIYVDSPRALLIRRLTGRRVCSRCGANYHIRTMRPKRAGLCDYCGGALVTRQDDQVRTIRKRLVVDHKTSTPLLNYYTRRSLLYRVNGIGHVDTVFQRTRDLFTRQGWLRDGALRRHDRAQKRRRD